MILVRRFGAALLTATGFILTACGGGSSGGAPPTVTPPTVTPQPQAISASPSSLSFTGANQTQAITLSEPGYNGPFRLVNACNNVATSGSVSANGPQANVNITSVAAGTCKFFASDSFNQLTTINVTVTTGTGVVQ